MNSLIDSSISSEQVARDFLFIEDNSAPDPDILERLIEETRKDIDSEMDDWQFINPLVFELNPEKREVHKYLKYKELDILKINVSDIEINNVYVLLNPEKDEILQYYWMKNNKIYSYNLFVQGTAAYFFSFNTPISKSGG